MRSKWIAYLLWFVGGFGWFGLHNFYLDRPLRGVIWIFTQGLFWIGSVYDLFTIHITVDKINAKIELDKINAQIELNKINTQIELDNNNRIRSEIQKSQNLISDSLGDLKFKVSIKSQSSNQEYLSKSYKLSNIDSLKNSSQRNKIDGVEYVDNKEAKPFDFSNDSQTESIVENNYGYDSYYDKTHFKELDISEKDKELIQFYFSSHRKFVEIKFCDIETFKLTLHLYNHLQTLLQSRELSLDETLTEKQNKRNIERKKEYKKLYGYIPEWFTNEGYSSEKSKLLGALQDISEYTLRVAYNYNRTIDTDYSYSFLKKEYNFDSYYIEKVIGFYSVKKPDLEAEIELNEHCPIRWKAEIKSIDVLQFDDLVNRNQKNRNLYKVLHKCCKLSVIQSERNLAIKYMLLSIQKSPKKKDRPKFTTTELKKLFPNKPDVNKFNDFVKTINKDTSLNEIQLFSMDFYHKKIIISNEAVKKAHQKHEAISSQIGEYLKDEDSSEEPDQASEIVKKKSKKVSTLEDIFIENTTGVEFEKEEKQLIDFVRSKKIVTIKQLQEFSKKKKIRFKKIINSINQKVYEVEEEILISNDDDEYVFDNDVYKEIT